LVRPTKSHLFKRNRFSLGVILVLCIMAGCKKKDRLSSSTFTLSIVPPAATLVKGQPLTLTARGRSSGTSVAVNPDWVILSGAPSNALNTSVGTSVILTPPSLGDVVV
jgi:hypothetical protein